MPKTAVVHADIELAPKGSKHVESKRALLIGGQSLLRIGIAEILRKHGIEVAREEASEEFLTEYLADKSEEPIDLILLILTGGPFAAIHRIREALGKTENIAPLVVLSEETGRGEVYAALRIGAKGYLDLNCDPQELLKAVDMAIEGKVYLAPGVAELLVNDMSAAFETPTGAKRLPSIELSRREVEIVQLLCEGLSSKEIARRLHLSAKTVENHRYNIYRKCQVDTIATLMRYAIKHGLISI
jgi:two-component system secretion response regulator SsrB